MSHPPLDMLLPYFAHWASSCPDAGGGKRWVGGPSPLRGQRGSSVLWPHPQCGSETSPSWIRAQINMFVLLWKQGCADQESRSVISLCENSCRESKCTHVWYYFFSISNITYRIYLIKLHLYLTLQLSSLVDVIIIWPCRIPRHFYVTVHLTNQGLI